MRCFYCGWTGQPASEEHIPSKFLGSRLKTRRVCKGCNKRAAEEIDNPFARYLMVKIPRALADVRSIDHQLNEPNVEVDGIVSTNGEPVSVCFTPRGREARRRDGEIVDDVVEVSYAMASDLWVRFMAKVALGCAAAQRYPDDWLDEPIAVGLRSLLWLDRIDNAIWPDGVPGWPDPLGLEASHPIRQALGDDRHLIGFAAAEDAAGSSEAIAMLFGGQICCRLPIPGVQVQGSGAVWVLDWHPGPPPRREDFAGAIERLLRERSTQQVTAARQPETAERAHASRGAQRTVCVTLDEMLSDALQEFRESQTGQQLHEPAEAVGRCKPGSLALLGLLRERGLDDASLLFMRREGEVHFVVQLGDLVLDPSCRQFPEHAGAEVPGVFRHDEVVTRWAHALTVHLSNPWDTRVYDVPRIPPEWRSAGRGLPAR